jgi:hypothetical protein
LQVDAIPPEGVTRCGIYNLRQHKHRRTVNHLFLKRRSLFY